MTRTDLPPYPVGAVVMRARGSSELGKVTAVYHNVTGQCVCEMLWSSGRHSRIRAISLYPATDRTVQP